MIVQHLTDYTEQSEAALAQSDFNIEKITEIQNKFAGGMVWRNSKLEMHSCMCCSKKGIAVPWQDIHPRGFTLESLPQRTKKKTVFPL